MMVYFNHSDFDRSYVFNYTLLWSPGSRVGGGALESEI